MVPYVRLILLENDTDGVAAFCLFNRVFLSCELKIWLKYIKPGKEILLWSS